MESTCLSHRQNDFSQYQNQLFFNYTENYVFLSKKQMNEGFFIFNCRFD